MPMVTKVSAAVLAALGLTAGAASQPASQARPAARTHAVRPAHSRALPVLFVAGHGWGHGVGLAQYGAYGYALHGWTFDRIVEHYFPGTTLDQAQVQRVRVLLAPQAPRAVVSSTAAFTVRDAAGKTHNLGAGAHVVGPGLKLKLSPSKPPRALPGPLFFSPGTSPLAFGGRAYRGTLRVKAAGARLQVVNVVGLEPYLWGVVPSEMPNRWPAEALAAQAVVARTYALAHLHQGDFDLYPDTRSQVYGGIAAESPSTTLAVNQTAGRVVLYDGELADTFFFSSSGGRTADVQDVWAGSKPTPYLVSVPDPYDTLSPYHNWGPLRFSAARIAKRLHLPGRITDFRANVAASGRVRTLTFVGTSKTWTVSGSAVRAALGLRSTWFRLGLLGLTSPAAPVVYGSSVRLSGSVRGVSAVTLEARVHGGGWKTLGRLKVSNGAVSSLVKPKVPTYYRLQSGGFRSGVVRVAVAPLVQLSAAADGASVAGLERPLLPGASVDVQRLGTGVWTTVATTAVESNGSFAAPVNLRPGSYRARVIGSGFAVGISKTLVVVAP